MARIFLLQVSAIVLIAACAAPHQARAGQLFPPANLTDPSKPCPGGMMLSWTGDTVACADPTPGVTIATCPQGQSLTGVNNGRPVCANMPFGGGQFQTYLCDAGRGFHVDGSGGCRLPNPVTGSCSCPEGFTPYHINDFNSPLNRCPQTYYESRGMMQWACN